MELLKNHTEFLDFIPCSGWGGLVSLSLSEGQVGCMMEIGLQRSEGMNAWGGDEI